jgi:hypothetical protein
MVLNATEISRLVRRLNDPWGIKASGTMVMGYIRAREPEVPPLLGLSRDYRLGFPWLPLPFAQGKRGGLRCGVPPGLPET